MEPLIPTTALYGIGGVGKTQIALAYADSHRSDYNLGWWISADDELSITTGFAKLAIAHGMSSDLAPGELAELAREVLAEQARWLLVLDNASNPTLVTKYLPSAAKRRVVPLVGRFLRVRAKGHVLLTTRSLAWQGIADWIPVDVLALNDAVELLLRRSGDSDLQTARTLAAELGQLPLALEQAAAYAGRYLTTYQHPLERYLTFVSGAASGHASEG